MLNPLAHRALDISLATITDETENYAQVPTTHAHTHAKITQIPQKVEGSKLLLCAIRRLASLLIMTLIHYERELEPGLCCCPNSNQAVNEAEKKWAEPGYGEPLQTCEFQHMYKNLPFYILRSGKWHQHREHTLKLCFYKICVRGIKL